MSERRIVQDQGICGGRPRIRGTRMRVIDIVEMVAAGAERKQILEDFPYLQDEDITAALLYAAQAVSREVLPAA